MNSLHAAAVVLALLAGSQALAQPAPTQPVLPLEPPVFEARYLAESMGLSATAHRVQTRSEDALYTLENSLSLTLLGATVGTVTETSAFRWQDGQVIPVRYRYSQTGLSAREETVEFDWQALTAVSESEEQIWRLPLVRGLQDKLSLSQEIAQQFRAGSMTQMRYDVVDGDRIEEQVFRLEGEQLVETHAGTLHTIRLERVRGAQSSRRTTIWLARDWHHLLVQLEDVSASGRLTRLSLESATVNGTNLEGR